MLIFKFRPFNFLLIAFGFYQLLVVNGDPLINVNALVPCFRTVCYHEIGCITPFISAMIILLPPLIMCPDSPSEVNVTYHVMTPKVKKSQFGTLKDLKPQTNLAFYAHGCFASYADKLTLAVGLALFHKYKQVVMVDWTRGANPRQFGKISIPLINIFLCAANSEVVGRLTANAMNYAIKEKRIDPSQIFFGGHSAGSHATAFAGQYLKERYGFTMGETVALDSSTAPFALSNKIMPGKGDALVVTRVLSTFNFPIPVLSDLRAIAFQLGYPFPTADTDIFLNVPYYFQDQLICNGFPMCSHFFATLALVGSLRNCLFEAQPCISNPLAPATTSFTGIRSSVFGRRGAICLRTPLNPLKGCECCSTKSRLNYDNDNKTSACPGHDPEFAKYYR